MSHNKTYGRVNRNRFDCEYWWKCQRAHTCQTEGDRAGAIYFVRRKFCFLWRGGRNFGPGYGTTSDYKAYMYDRPSCWNRPTCGIHPSCESYIWAAALQNKQNDLCAQRRLRSTRASAITMGSWWPNVSSCGQRRLWSDLADVQADLNLRRAQKSFCWFGRTAVHIKASHAVKRS